MQEISAFNMRTRKKTYIKNPELVTLKNGRKAVRGIAGDDGKTKLFRIISNNDAKKFNTSK